MTKKAPLQMQKGEGIADAGGAVRNCQGKNGRARCRVFPQGTNEEVWIKEVKGTAVDEEASSLGRFPPWKKPRAFGQTGKTSRWRPGNQEEGNEEMWERSRGWKRDWRLGLVFFCRGAGRRGDGVQGKARSVPIGARQAVPVFQWQWQRVGRLTVARMPRHSQGIHQGWCVFSPQDPKGT